MRREVHEFLERRAGRAAEGFPLALGLSLALHAGVLALFFTGTQGPARSAPPPVSAPAPPPPASAPAPPAAVSEEAAEPHAVQRPRPRAAAPSWTRRAKPGRGRTNPPRKPGSRRPARKFRRSWS